MRVSFSIYVLTATTLGSLGAFLLFPWPPVFREIVLTCLSVFVIMGSGDGVRPAADRARRAA